MELFADTWRYLIEADSWTGSGGLVARLAEQLLLTVTALVAAILLGLPLALWLGHLGRGGFLAVNISNVGRAVPTFALLALLVAADWPGSGDFGPYGRAGLATLIALVQVWATATIAALVAGPPPCPGRSRCGRIPR